MKFRCAVVAALAVGALLVGCGEGEGEETATRQAAESRPAGPREAWVTLDGYQGPQNVGLLMAAQRGYFKDVGINVSMSAPLSPGRPLYYVLDGSIDFGVAHQPQVVMASGEGEPIVAVGSLVPRTTSAMIWLEKSKLRGIADLKGKTIAILDIPFEEEFLQVLLARVGLTLEDVEVLHAGYELLPPLLGGRADAIFGGSWNVEGTALEARGLKPVVTKVQSLGIPAYDELVVVARSDRVSKEPQLVRDFMSAVRRGTAAAVKNPEAAVKLLDGAIEADPLISRKGTRAGVEATLPLLSRTGYMDPTQAGHLVDWMHSHGLIEQEPPPSDLLTNDYLGLGPE